MKKNSILVKAVLMSMLTAGSIFSFTSCADDVEFDKAPEAPQTELTNQTRAGSSDYNINEHYVTYGNDEQNAEPFDTKNWQKESAIFCYVGSAKGDDKIYDSKTKKQLAGFKLVNLPWSNKSTASNIPPKIWKEMMAAPGGNQAKNPWKLVLMNCGKEGSENGNFLGFYNQLTGVLRMFVFVPEGIDAKGNNHMWGVLLNDKLSSRSIFRYGVPTDRNITSNKSKLLLKQTDEMAQIISPWKRGKFTGFNDCPMTPGWWAFDMDFSLYRNNDDHFTRLQDCDDVLSFNPLCKTDESLKMESKLFAKLQGSIQLEATQASTSSGIFAPLEELLGKANDIASLVDIAKGVIDPNPLNAIENGIKLAKGVCNVAGIDYGQETTGFNGYQGNMNLALDGTIDTKGVISKQENVSGMMPISFKKGDFITENCPSFGEGIWNLEHAPVVYHTNAFVGWKHEYDGYKSYYTDKRSPFKGEMNHSGINDPNHGHVCYFDPTSIKVVLNPNIFTADEIQKAKVYATCGVRRSAEFGSTDAYREAQGLTGSKFDPCGFFGYFNRSFYEAPFDALSSHLFKMRMKAATTFNTNVYNGNNYGVFGRGDADYLIEPQALTGGNAPEMMPAYEVTVTVVVNHNGQSIVYTRNYLPEYKEMHIENMPEITKEYMSKNMPLNYVPEIFRQQMCHIKDIRNWTRRTLHPTDGTPYHLTANKHYSHNGITWDVDQNKFYDSKNESFAALFDNDLSNRWVSVYDNVYYKIERYIGGDSEFYAGRSVDPGCWKNRSCWYVEFKSHFPISPTSYCLISSNDAAKYKNYSPRVWYMYGKKNLGDPWIKLASSSYNNQPEDMLPSGNNQSTRKIPFRLHDANDMQYFRFEVQQDDSDKGMIRLGEIRFNYY